MIHVFEGILPVLHENLRGKLAPQGAEVALGIGVQCAEVEQILG